MIKLTYLDNGKLTTGSKIKIVLSVLLAITLFSIWLYVAASNSNRRWTQCKYDNHTDTECRHMLRYIE